MRVFRPEVQLALKTIAVITLIGMIVLPVSWGYEQRREARRWHRTACAYRIQEVTRRAPFLASIDQRHDPCATLERLGLDLERPR